MRAALHGHDAVHFDDVKAVAPGVLGHRIGLSFAAEAEGVTAADMVEHVLATVKHP